MTDAIPFSSVKILNSPDISAWPVTSEITALGLRPSSLHLEHTKQGQWPAVRFGDALQESTLWIFLHIGADWWASGVERIRPAQVDKPEHAPSHERDDWFYDPNRWHQMTGHQPAPGELVGFCVAAGDTRGFGNVVVQERSAIVLVDFPPDAGKDYPPFASLAPADGGGGGKNPDDVTGGDAFLDQLIASEDALLAALNKNTTAMQALTDKLEVLRQAGLRVHL